MVMKKKAFIVLTILLLFCLNLEAQTTEKFKTKPGMVFIGGGLSLSFMQNFSNNSSTLFSIDLNPLFGQFITKEVMLFTHLGFSIKNYSASTTSFTYPDWNGSLNIGAQGRYYFSTEEAVNFFIGLDVTLGLDLAASYDHLNEHIITGLIGGIFLPLNQKIGLEISLAPFFYLPLNTYQSWALFIPLSLGILSTL
jgi:hypothetical protein